MPGKFILGLSAVALTAGITFGLTQNNANKQIDELKKQNSELSTQLESEKSDKQKYFDALQESARTLEAKNILLENLNSELNTMESSLSKAKQAYASKQAELEQKQLELTDANAYITSLQSLLNSANSDKASLQSQLDTALENKATLETQVATLTSECDVLQIHINELTEENDALNSTITLLTEEVAELSFNFEVDGNSITRYTGGYVESLTIPASYSLSSKGKPIAGDDYKITVLAKNFFVNAPKIRNIIISEGITTIPENAFSSVGNMTSLSIPDSIKFVGKNFVSTNYLTKVCTLAEDGCYYLGNENNPYVLLVKANNTTLTNLTLPETTKVIYYQAFNNVTSLSSIDLKNVVSIGEYTFAGTGLTNVEIPSSVEQISAYTFNGCSLLTEATLADGITAIGDSAFSNSGLTTINLPETLNTIGVSAFSSTKLTEIIVPGSVENIQNNTFFNCTSLTSIILNEGVKNVYSNAFIQCGALTTFSIPNSIEYFDVNIQDYAETLSDVFFEYEGCYYLGNENNPFVVLVDIAGEATNYTSNLIHSKAKIIGCYALEGCLSPDFRIPGNITHVGKFAFSSCPVLSDIYVSEGVKYIDNSAFATNYQDLLLLELPSTIEKIGSSAWSSSLTTLNIKATTPPTLGSNNVIAENAVIIVPKGSIDAYKTATYWSAFADKFVESED